MKDSERFHKDKSERWLLQHQAGSILRLVGITGFTSWTVVESSLVAPRRLPDGLVNVNFPDRPKPLPVLIEIESYANADAERQMFENLLLARLELGVIPEAICVVLQPKGKVRVREKMQTLSGCGVSKVAASWKVVEVWKLKADDLLAQNDLGLIPLVPLAKITGPAESTLRECRDRIDRDAPEQRAEVYRVVTQILGRMVHPLGLLDAIFGGRNTMIESPAYLDFENEVVRRLILKRLEKRFAVIPDDVRERLKGIEDLSALEKILTYSYESRDITHFAELLAGLGSNWQ